MLVVQVGFYRRGGILTAVCISTRPRKIPQHGGIGSLGIGTEGSSLWQSLQPAAKSRNTLCGGVAPWYKKAKWGRISIGLMEAVS